MKPGSIAFPCVFALTAATLICAQAAAADIQLKPIVIRGDDNFNAASVNGAGVIAGTLYAGITDDASAILLDASTVTTLPSPGGNFGPFNPRVINDGGAVLGWARNTGGLASTNMFLYEDGAYNPAYQAILIEPGSNISNDMPLQMQLTRALQVSFNTLVSLSGPVGTSYGRPPNYAHVPAMNRFTHINSINTAGTVAGVTYSFNGIAAVYTGTKQKFTTITPPNSRSTSGGYVNDKGALAGSFEDTSGAYHGFVYQNAAFTIFDMPVAASNVTVNAINDRGRVVGSYADSNGRQHGFLYNGNKVTSIGSFPYTDTVMLAIGSNNATVLARQIDSSDPKYLSYRVICTGNGC